MDHGTGEIPSLAQGVPRKGTEYKYKFSSLISCTRDGGWPTECDFQE